MSQIDNKQSSTNNNIQQQSTHHKQLKHPTMKLLNEYKQKLSQQQQLSKSKLSFIKSSVYKLFEQQFNLQFSIFQKSFLQSKYYLNTQTKIIDYYIQNFILKHSHNPKQNNLYPLFNQIDQKLNYNYLFIQNNFNFQFIYPQNKHSIHSKINFIKTQIITKQFEQLKSFIAQNQNIKKYCNKQLKQIKQIHSSYEHIFQIAQKKYFTPSLQFTGTLSQVLLALKMSKNIQRLNIGIRNNSRGIMSIQEYKQLMRQIIRSKNLLTNVAIKIMDMQFEEMKCNIIKQMVKELKVIKNFKLQNYYKQNKLGQFEDFNWYPLKKQTHIIGKVW